MACSLEASPATKARRQALFILWGLYCYPRSLPAGMGLGETLWYTMPTYKSIVHKTADSFVARSKITKDHRSYENAYLDNYGENVTISSDIQFTKAARTYRLFGSESSMSCIFVVQLRRVCSVFSGDLTIEYSSAEQGFYYYYYARYDSSEPRVYFWREKLPMDISRGHLVSIQLSLRFLFTFLFTLDAGDEGEIRNMGCCDRGRYSNLGRAQTPFKLYTA
jgi:hypothetical protein